ncbi:uncharacterized protein LOC124159490 [Ischnura elegans]|uniref:uncharacterized protein LOC124159490 n=1 Tax=Ischnura elegans TaxID=197161 RepID=UPI001ED867CA|nr:uncharacterized protein LOC124159490 [Ischnura elegans]
MLENDRACLGGPNGTKRDRCTWLTELDKSYSNSTILIGNWCENRGDHEDSKNDVWPVYDGTNPLSSITEYKENYLDTRHYLHEVAEEDWDSKFKEEPEHLALLGRQKEYLENMASSYDLQYRFCLRGNIRGEIPDTRPESCLQQKPYSDYTLSYGNVTEFGLLQYKRFQWQQEKNDVNYVRSTYQMSFGCPISKKSGQHKIFGRSSKPFHVNAQNIKSLYPGNATVTNHKY